MEPKCFYVLRTETVQSSCRKLAGDNNYKAQKVS